MEEKNQVFGNGPIRRKKCQHLGKMPRSIHGKLPIERHFSQRAADQTYIF